MVKPPRVMVLIPSPSDEITRTPATRDRGMARVVIRVVRTLPRKRNSTTTTRTAPSRSAVVTFSIATSMKSA